MYMCTKLAGGHGNSSFGDIAPFQIWPNIVHGSEKMNRI